MSDMSGESSEPAMKVESGKGGSRLEMMGDWQRGFSSKIIKEE